MSFGFGIGDFISVLELAYKVRERWKDAPIEFEAIRGDVKRLHDILKDLHDLSQRVDISASQKVTLTNIIVDCKAVLAEANKIAGSYSKSSGKRVQRSLGRLRADVGAVKRVRAQLQFVATQLNTVQGNILIGTNLDSKRDLNDKTELEIINWCSPATFVEQQTTQLQFREPGTAEWFLQHPTYISWYGGSKQTLFCPGIKGSGKSVTFATVVNDIQTRFEHNPEVKAIYFYFNYKRQDEQEFTRILRSLIRQLFQDKVSLPDCIRNAYNQHSRRGSEPSEDELYSLVEALTKTYQKVLILVDALDECKNSRTRDKLLSYLTQLQNKAAVDINIMTTCRPGVVRDFDNHPQIEIRAQPEDVKRYLSTNVTSVVPCVANHPNEQNKITEGIASIVDGMFLLAHLHLDSLGDKHTIRAVRKAMECLPRGSASAALDKAYEEVLQRINQQSPGLKELARKTLTWMIHARRELSMDELREALAIEPDITEIDPQIDLVDEHIIISVCAGLVIFDEGSGVVRFAHYTTQVYLEQNQERWLPGGKVYVAESCISYLLMEALYLNGVDWNMNFWDMMQQYKLLYYVGKHWGFHAHELGDVSEYVSPILCKRDSLCLTSQLALGSLNVPRRGKDEYWIRDVTPLHVCAYFDDARAASHLLKSGHDANLTDSCKRTALHVAAEHNGHNVAARLLEDPTIYVNMQNESGDTALNVAARCGHIKVVETLLAHHEIDVQAACKHMKTPLSSAADRDHANVVTRLLEHRDIDVNTRDKDGHTPLALAAWQGSIGIVTQLLARPEIDVNLGDQFGYAPAAIAEFYGRNEIMALLLARPEIQPFELIRFQS